MLISIKNIKRLEDAKNFLSKLLHSLADRVHSLGFSLHKFHDKLVASQQTKRANAVQALRRKQLHLLRAEDEAAKELKQAYLKEDALIRRRFSRKYGDLSQKRHKLLQEASELQ